MWVELVHTFTDPHSLDEEEVGEVCPMPSYRHERFLHGKKFKLYRFQEN